MIEAVFEDPAVKAQVFKEIEPHLAPDALLGSNTSTLPITGLAENVTPPGGLHRAALLLARRQDAAARDHQGRATSDETLYRALDLAKLIKKTPIVVNDSRGFFTSRVIGTFINEGIAMLTRGHPGADDRAGLVAGRLPGAGAAALRRAQHEADAQDPRRREGGGAGRRRTVGRPPVRDGDRPDARTRPPGPARGRGLLRVRRRQARRPLAGPEATSSRRSTTRPRSRSRTSRSGCWSLESLESVKCLDEGVIESVADANIGSILGIGFPGWTGGVLQYINGYEGGVGRVSSLARASWPPNTASGSSRPRRWSRRPSAASVTPTRRRWSRPAEAALGKAAGGRLRRGRAIARRPWSPGWCKEGQIGPGYWPRSRGVPVK